MCHYLRFLQVVQQSYQTKITMGCVKTILLLIEAKALRSGRNKNNINMCNRSSLIMANFWIGTNGTFHFNLVPRVFSFSNNEMTLETSAKCKTDLRLIYFWHLNVNRSWRRQKQFAPEFAPLAPCKIPFIGEKCLILVPCLNQPANQMKKSANEWHM